METIKPPIPTRLAVVRGKISRLKVIGRKIICRSERLGFVAELQTSGKHDCFKLEQRFASLIFSIACKFSYFFISLEEFSIEYETKKILVKRSRHRFRKNIQAQKISISSEY